MSTFSFTVQATDVNADVTSRALSLILFGDPADTSYEAVVLADAPRIFCRHNDLSTSLMNNVGVSAQDGYYDAGVELSQPALYTGGPLTAKLDLSNRGYIDGGALPSATAMTLEAIIRPENLTGFKGIISRDTAERVWQWRLNGSQMEFVTIIGGVNTVAGPSLTGGVATHVAVTVSATGVVKLYKNGVLSVTSAALGARQFGQGSALIEFGYMQGGGYSPLAGRMAESAVYDYALSDARIAVHAAAAGF